MHKLSHFFIILISLLVAIQIIIISCDQNNLEYGETPPDPVIVDGDIENLKVTVLDATDDINLTWQVNDDADSYNIYRYLSKTDSNPVSFTSSHNEYFDTSALYDTPYFYKVACVSGGIERGYSEMVFGLYRSEKDEFEPNNLFSEIEQTAASVPIINQTFNAMIYSCPDGTGSVESDVDWYKYHGPVKSIFIDVDISSSDLNDGDLKIIFYFEGNYKNEEDILIGSNEFSFEGADYDGASGDADVYFKIFVDESSVDKSKNILETYSIQLRDSF